MRRTPSLLGALVVFGCLGCASTAGVRTQPNDARYGVTCEAILAMMHMETSPQLGRYGEELAKGCRDKSDDRLKRSCR